MSPSVLPDVPLGTRVVVRYLIEGGDRATDALGQLTGRDASSLTVLTKQGAVTIPVADVVVAKRVPAAPQQWRLASFLRRAAVAVLDLDGVLRTFDSSGRMAEAELALGLPRGEFFETAFQLPQVPAMVTGRATYAEWIDALRDRLLADGLEPGAVAHAVETFDADRGTPVAPTLQLVEELIAADTPVFIFTNGTDRVPAELEQLGLGHLLPGLLNAHDLGFAKPAPESYAVAHAQIEERLGRRVGVAEVHFTDDRPANVDAARVFGWQARVFTMPSEARS